MHANIVRELIYYYVVLRELLLYYYVQAETTDLFQRYARWKVQ